MTNFILILFLYYHTILITFLHALNLPTKNRDNNHIMSTKNENIGTDLKPQFNYQKQERYF